VYFGAQLIKEAYEACAKIKAFHNRYFVPMEMLASGKSMTAMYMAMKKQLLKVYAQQNGYNTLSRNNQWKNWTDEQKAKKMHAYRKKKLRAWESKGDRYYLPDYWLTFLLCSKPIAVIYPGQKLTLDCLVPPEVAVPVVMPLAAKAVRRADRATAGRVRGNASASVNVPDNVQDLTADVDDNSVSNGGGGQSFSIPPTSLKSTQNL